MATIQKRGDAYKITVSDGYAAAGRQIRHTVTWTPAHDLTEKQIEKEHDRQAVLFEEKVRTGQYVDGNIRFSEYAEMWMESAQLAPVTRTVYNDLLTRINHAIGNIKLDKLQSHHLEAFYRNLKENGVKNSGRWAVTNGFDELIKERKLSRVKAAAIADVCATTIGDARNGKKISFKSAEKIATAFGKKTTDLFTVHVETTGLSDKTVLHHHRLISAILEKAKRERYVPYNIAAEYVTPPKVKRKEPVYLDDEQARDMVFHLLDERDIRIKTALILLLYSGLRRGELCGLSWADIQPDKGLIHVMRASQFQEGRGIVEVPTKNESSVRAVKLPSVIFGILADYKTWWTEQRLIHGDKWQGDAGRLFIQSDGKPINPQTINKWLADFLERNGLPKLTPHSLRHTFATLQIAAGVDLKTIQARGGWADGDTPMKIYAHAIKSAAEAATDALDQILTPEQYRKA